VLLIAVTRFSLTSASDGVLKYVRVNNNACAVSREIVRVGVRGTIFWEVVRLKVQEEQRHPSSGAHPDGQDCTQTTLSPKTLAQENRQPLSRMDRGVTCLDLQGLPVQVIASHITPLLDIRDLVALGCAGGVNLQEAQSLMPPIKLPSNIDRSVGIWLLKRGYSLRGCVFLSWAGDKATDLSSVAELYCEQLYDVHLALPNDRIEAQKLFPQISKLDLRGPLVCGHIEKLCLIACNIVELFATEHAPPEQLSQLLRATPKLSKLSCTYACLPKMIPALRLMGKKLKELSLSTYTADGAVELIAELSALCPNLEHLGIVDQSTTRNSADVEPVLAAFAEECCSLSKVTIIGYTLTAGALRQLLRKCRRLCSVDWSGYEWSAEDILTAAEYRAPLESISLCHALLGDVETYAALFAHLQRVRFSGGILLSGSAVAAVSHMRALVSIELCCWAGFGAKEEDVSAVLDAVAATCTELREWSCSGKYMADHRFASALAAVIIHNTRISSVRLAGDGRCFMGVTIMPQVLVNALAQCQSLRYCTIECYNVTDSQMLSIIVSARGLERCAVGKCPGLTDVFLSALAEHCRHLSWLCVSKCPQFTEPALVQLAQRCRKLTNLGVHRKSVSIATVTVLRGWKRLYKLDIQMSI
jgi:hypothetical protein